MSPVQEKAVYLCEMQDMYRQNDTRDRDFRTALFASGQYNFADLFPEVSEATTDEQITAAINDENVDISWQIKYDEEFDPAEAERMIMELMAQASSGEASGAMFLEDQDGA